MLRLSYVEYNQSKARVSRIQLLVAVILEVLSSLILSICSCIDIRPMIFVLLVVIMTFSIPCFERCDYIYTYIYIYNSMVEFPAMPLWCWLNVNLKSGRWYQGSGVVVQYDGPGTLRQFNCRWFLQYLKSHPWTSPSLNSLFLLMLFLSSPLPLTMPYWIASPFL